MNIGGGERGEGYLQEFWANVTVRNNYFLFLWYNKKTEVKVTFKILFFISHSNKWFGYVNPEIMFLPFYCRFCMINKKSFYNSSNRMPIALIHGLIHSFFWVLNRSASSAFNSKLKLLWIISTCVPLYLSQALTCK